MQTKKALFILYNWFTTLIWIVVLFWFSSQEDLQIGSDEDSLFVERITYFLGFSFLFLLIYRSLINTFRLTVEKLAFTRSKEEAKEDREFVLIVETLLLSNAILLSVFIAVANNLYLETISGREVDIYLFLINSLGILVFALITYSWPVLSIIEARIAKLTD